MCATGSLLPVHWLAEAGTGDDFERALAGKPPVAPRATPVALLALLLQAEPSPAPVPGAPGDDPTPAPNPPTPGPASTTSARRWGSVPSN